MYYKIENKECEVYQKLHAMRSEEQQFEKENMKAIEEKTGLKFESFLGHRGQQSFGRVTTYSGFIFTEPDKVDLKIWKKSPDIDNGFVPNKRTKEGKEMAEFLSNGLKRHWFGVVFDNIGIEQPVGRFSFPFVEICGDVIILFLGDEAPELTDPNIEEITKREFNNLLDLINKTRS